MPAGPHIGALKLRTKGLQSAFVEMYSSARKQLDTEIADLFFEIPASTNVENFAALEDVPIPDLIRRGDPTPFATLSDFDHEVVIVKFGKGLRWFLDDEEDDQLGTLRPRVGELAGHFPLLKIRAAQDFLAGTTVLLDSVPSAFDGVDLVSTTPRPGATLGNSQTGSGTGSEAAYIRDFNRGLSLAKGFTMRTTAEPFWPSDLLDQMSNWLLIFSTDAKVMEIAKAAFEPKRTQIILDKTGAAGVTNPMSVHTDEPRLKFWSRISGGTWYMVWIGSPSLKPFILGNRHASPKMKVYDENTSDWAKDFDGAGVAWKQRMGFAAFAWQTIIETTN